MITKNDLLEAIAECQGERYPNAHTCTKLAAFYTVLDHIEQKETAPQEIPIGSYSYASGPMVEYDGESEFAHIIQGMEQTEVWKVVDELMSAVEVLQPRLYAATIRQLNEVKQGS